MEQQRIQQDGSRLQNQTDLGNRSLSCQTMLDAYKLAQDSYDHAFNKFSQGGRGSTQVGNAQVFVAEKAATFAAMSAAGCVPQSGAPVEAPPSAMLKDEAPPPVIETQPLPRPAHVVVKHHAPTAKTDCPPK